MKAKQYLKRQALIANGLCPRCGRPVKPWPLKRADVCAPDDFQDCIRHWPDIMKAERQLVARSQPLSQKVLRS